MKKLIILLMAAGLFTACDSDNKGKDKYDRDKSSVESREKDDYRSSSKSSDNADNSNLDTKTSTDEPQNIIGAAAGWPQIERRGFLKSCEREATSTGTDKLTAQSFCQCMLDKMEASYPDIKVAAKLTEEQVNQFGMQNRADCLEEH